MVLSASLFSVLPYTLALWRELLRTFPIVVVAVVGVYEGGKYDPF